MAYLTRLGLPSAILNTENFFKLPMAPYPYQLTGQLTGKQNGIATAVDLVSAPDPRARGYAKFEGRVPRLLLTCITRLPSSCLFFTIYIYIPSTLFRTRGRHLYY